LSIAIRNSKSFEVLSAYTSPESALAQSSIYNPNLFLIDADNPEFLEMIPAFVDTFPQAEVLAMTMGWNPDIAYEVQKTGAVGTVLKNYRPEEMEETINLGKKRGKPDPARTICFFSPKGRAGRTTLAALLALNIVEKTQETVALIDADLQFGDLPIFFDVEPQHTIVDAVHDIKLLTPVAFASYFHEIKKNLYMLSSPDRPEYAELIDADTLIEIIKMAGHCYRYLLIDLPTGFNPISLAVSNFVDTNFVVSMINTGLEGEHMRRSLDMFRERSNAGKANYPIFTRVNPCTDEERFKLEMQIGYPLTEIFPNEYNLVSMANSGRIMKDLPKNSVLIKRIDELSNKIISGEL
jgi:pilus assembly protein CpaE